MTTEKKSNSCTLKAALFISGICKLKDSDIKSYFKKFGSPIESYDVFREQKISPCCYALITFSSIHTAPAIMRHRPHKIQASSLYVKRTDLRDTTPILERYLPATILTISFKPNITENEKLLREKIKLFGPIVSYRHDPKQKAFIIEYQDYDSVDEFCFNMPYPNLAFNVRRSFQSTSNVAMIYMESCNSSKTVPILNQQKNLQPLECGKILPKETSNADSTTGLPNDQSINAITEALTSQLNKSLKELEKAKAGMAKQTEVKNILGKECERLRARNLELETLLKEKEMIANICGSCELQQITITSLQMSLCRMKNSYEHLKFEYERLLSQKEQADHQHSGTNDRLAMKPIRKSISTRINNFKDHKQKLSDDQLFEFQQQYSSQPRIDHDFCEHRR